jgi:hypothetical protein
MDGLKIGSLVTIKTRWRTITARLDKESKTMWFCDKGGFKIYKKNNRVVGDLSASVNLTTQEDINEMERARLGYELSETDFRELSLIKLKSILKIINEK